MGKMNLLIFIMVSGLLMLASGCGTLPMTSWENQATQQFSIKVTSEPDGAEVYFDNMLIGRTPADSLSIGIPSTTTHYVMGVDDHRPQGNHNIRVSKRGYKDAVEVVEYSRQDMAGINHVFWIKKNEYHFVLEPDIQNVQDGVSGEISKAEEISRYKKLMDEGTITKEEFEQKKKQLLSIRD